MCRRPTNGLRSPGNGMSRGFAVSGKSNQNKRETGRNKVKFEDTGRMFRGGSHGKVTGSRCVSQTDGIYGHERNEIPRRGRWWDGGAREREGKSFATHDGIQREPPASRSFRTEAATAARASREYRREFSVRREIRRRFRGTTTTMSGAGKARNSRSDSDVRFPIDRSASVHTIDHATHTPR